KTIFDKYGDQFFYGSLLLGTFMSVLAGIWKFMTKDTVEAHQPSMRLYALVEKINGAKSETELGAVERQIDENIKEEVEKGLAGKGGGGENIASSHPTPPRSYLKG